MDAWPCFFASPPCRSLLFKRKKCKLYFHFKFGLYLALRFLLSAFRCSSCLRVDGSSHGDADRGTRKCPTRAVLLARIEADCPAACSAHVGFYRWWPADFAQVDPLTCMCTYLRLFGRSDPEIGRTICKTCHTLLVPGQTSTVRTRQHRERHLVVTCNVCGTKRRYRLRKNHALRSDTVKPEIL